MLRHDMQHGNPDFLPLQDKANSITPVGIVSGDMGFDDGGSHAGAKRMNAAAMIPARHADAPVWRN